MQAVQQQTTTIYSPLSMTGPYTAFAAFAAMQESCVSFPFRSIQIVKMGSVTQNPDISIRIQALDAWKEDE